MNDADPDATTPTSRFFRRATEPVSPLVPADRATLIRLARRSIRYGFEAGEPLPVDLAEHAPALRAERATFVTLKREGQLRGCIGGLEPQWPLVTDAVRHAFAAAFSDPRFPPLARAEYEALTVHISVLSPREPLAFEGEEDLRKRLQPGVDGLILHYRGRRATFLPSVWDSLSTPERFVRELKRKAGIPIDAVPERAERYRSESFGEE